MARVRPRSPRRQHVGKVAYFLHHGDWYVYYRDGGQAVRRRVGTSEAAAAQAAAQINAQLAIDAPTLFSFTPISVPEFRRRFLDHHEHVLRSSLATIRRYKTATQHLEDFVLLTGMKAAHQVRPDDLIRYLREKLVAPNGHPKATRRKLRDKGIRYILEVCRSLYGCAARHRHLPPCAEIPFSDLACLAVRIEDANSSFSRSHGP